MAEPAGGGAPWLVRTYRDAAPRPRGSVLAHELFAGLIWRAAASDWKV